VDFKLEVIGIPVSDVDTAKTFYSDIGGFTMDHDVPEPRQNRAVPGPSSRVESWQVG